MLLKPSSADNLADLQAEFNALSIAEPEQSEAASKELTCWTLQKYYA
jgi:hypothetical protein